MTADRIFRWLLRLFPAAFRDRFGDDMHDVFRDQLVAARRRRHGVPRLWLRIVLQLPAAAFLEHRDALRARRRRAITLSDPTRTPDMLESSTHDLRFAIRMLRRSPIFTLVAVLAISLGAGAVTTIYSAMNAIVLRPLPGTVDGARLVGLELMKRDGRAEMSGTSALYERLRDQPQTMSGMAAWGRVTLSLAASGGEGAVVTGNYASANYFSVLGLRPALGRFFLPEEDRTPGTHPVLVISHAFWTAHLGGDSSVVGRTIGVNGRPYTVIGVGPQGFRGTVALIGVDGWVPLAMQGVINPDRNLVTARWLRMFGRLRDGVEMPQAQAELSALAAAHELAAPPADSARRVTGVRLAMLRAVPEDARGQFLGFMALLLGASVFVLLIASVNVASMLSARAVARRREMALRAALGAGRGRLVAQMLTEILVLFGLGAAGGVAFAFAATRAAMFAPLPDVVVPPDMAPDLRVMAFALILSLVTGLLFGLAPAFGAVGTDISIRLRDGAAGSGARRTRVRSALIVGQLALSLVLLVAAGLFIRALDVGSRVDPGFDRRGIAAASFDTRVWGYDDAKSREFYRTLQERIAALPGVTGATLASFAPITTRSMNDSIGIAEARVFTWFTNVDDRYFTTLRLPLVAGRGFAPTDDERAPRVAVVNETLARRLAPDGNAIGRTFTRGRTTVTVVGIARDAKYASYFEETPAMAYYALQQSWQPHQTLLVRGIGAAPLARALRAEMSAMDPTVPAPTAETLDRLTSITTLPQRIAAIVTGVLGGLGLLLAALGLYGIIAYGVQQRTRELGVRVALGARAGDVVGLVVRDGMRLAVAGVALGLVLATWATRLIAGFLFDVSALDTMTFAGMSALFVGVALLATYVPARRAARADPMVALRAE